MKNVIQLRIKKLTLLILVTFSFNMFSQTFEEKTEEFVSIPYRKIEYKVDFLIDSDVVNSLQIDEYQIDNYGSFKPTDTTLFKSHFLKYKDGKIMTNLIKVVNKDSSLLPEQLEKVMTYDSSGRLSNILTTYLGKEKTVTIQKFNYSNDIIKRIYYSEKDTINPDNEMYTYRVDNDNYIIRESILMNKYLISFDFKYNTRKDEIFNNYGTYDKKMEHLYDKSGNKTQTTFTIINKDDGTIKYTNLEKYIYDNNNNLIKVIFDNESKNVIEYKYEDNRLVEVIEFSKGKVFTKNKFKYDNSGNWIEIEFIRSKDTEKIVKRKINYK
ncbi:hypothetical protein GOQ30_09500 [Flavobacterium sp. TP390]|uniref:Sugar-binding protein n=1 Tax=Flavobacterium profundi TaxID=1774945 RepID=A0A6I4ILR3_9FLAO|nr:hypothetical protein [Flavobacterium profundi]MVO09392.1 hypothetical protein [Flavobacterium profundi]